MLLWWLWWLLGKNSAALNIDLHQSFLRNSSTIPWSVWGSCKLFTLQIELIWENLRLRVDFFVNRDLVGGFNFVDIYIVVNVLVFRSLNLLSTWIYVQVLMGVFTFKVRQIYWLLLLHVRVVFDDRRSSCVSILHLLNRPLNRRWFVESCCRCIWFMLNWW